MRSGRAEARFQLDCPRCSGEIGYLENAGAVSCPFCRGQFFLGGDEQAGWLAIPRVTPDDALPEAKRWLRVNGHRVTRMGVPFGLMLPFYWVRGKHFSWSVVEGYASRSETNTPGGADVWTPRFQVNSYGHSFSAHPLSALLPGTATRLGAQTLTLLDPDRLPNRFQLLSPGVSREDVETKVSAWLASKLKRRRSRGKYPTAVRAEGQRLSLVGIPVVVVRFSFRDRAEGAVIVDGLSGKALSDVPDSLLPAIPEPGDTEGFPESYPRSQLDLVPLECPGCAWELALRERDRLHPCPNCGLCWELIGAKRVQVDQWFLDRPTDETDQWLPFWVFGPPLGARELRGDTTLVPAYEGRHLEDQLHLAVRLSRTPPVGPWLPHGQELMSGATVGHSATAAWRWAFSGALARETFGQFLSFLRQDSETAVPERPTGIAWIPFRPEGRDLVEIQSGARTRALGTVPWRVDRAA